MKKLVAFDLDGTLAPSKSPAPPEIVRMLKELISKYEVCIISGGSMNQFEKQLFSSEEWGSPVSSGPRDYHKLHIMPTCGGQYHVFTGGKWAPVYKEEFTREEVIDIKTALGWVEGGYFFPVPKLLWGPQVEDRGSQITFSALGQEAPTEEKEKWDPDGLLREEVRDFLINRLPGLEIRIGGSTSIDITKYGIDKAFGMRKMLEHLNLPPEEAIFFGDKLEPGGNDYPVKETGIESVAVTGWQDTIEKVKEKL
jgi:HAD superfamily hydrolase (TIGR01484 family)